MKKWILLVVLAAGIGLLAMSQGCDPSSLQDLWDQLPNATDQF